MKKKSRFSIPQPIIDCVDKIEFSTNAKTNQRLNSGAKYFCVVLLTNSRFGGGFKTTIDMPQKYIETFLTHRDSQIILKKLKSTNIIITDEHYYNGCGKKGKSKSYKFNEELTKYDKDMKWGIVIFDPKKTKKDKLSDTKIFEKTIEILSKLEINDDVNEWINNYVINDENIKINDEIGIKYNLEINGYFINTSKYIFKEGMDLIEYSHNNKKTYFVENINEFKIWKTEELKELYQFSIREIKDKCLRAERNDTNNRFDHNLTNMKSELIDYLTLDGQKLVEIDITNSQFAFLANTDAQIDGEFQTLAMDGCLYEYVRDSYNKAKKEKISRTKAKVLMYIICFDKVRLNDANQIFMRELFPKTMKYIDEYKIKNGYNEFAIHLQKLESKMMIDGLLVYLLNKGFEVITIHDSVRCKENEYNTIKNHIDNYFKSVNFICDCDQKSKRIKKK